MKRIRPLAEQDIPELVLRWNQFFPAKYAMDDAVFRLNTFDAPTFDFGASSAVVEEGRIRGYALLKRSPSDLYRGPDRDRNHLSAIVFDEPVIGVDLLAGIKPLLRNRGVLELAFGQDTRHFFPGCPVEFSPLVDFLKVEGFLGTWDAVDLERDLSQYSVPSTRPGAEYRMVSPAERPQLIQFFEREFPGRWQYDVLGKFDAEEERQAVFGLFWHGNLEGFALLQREGCRLPIGGAVWQKSLGDGWGSLGPIGISKAIRGSGLGGALLDHALYHLHLSGAKQAIIDWTGLADFYRKYGFQVTRTYRSMTLPLELR